MTTPQTPPALEAPALQRLLDAGDDLAKPRLIDVRTPGEFETVHIPGSYSVPLDLLREHRAELRAHLGEQVVLICRSGQRAAQAEQALADADLPTCASCTAGSPRGRRPAGRSPPGVRGGSWSARSAWSPARSCWQPSWPAPSCLPPNGSPR